MRIIFNYYFIFAPCICNSYFSNRYILNDPFSDDRILDVTIHNGYISDRYFECPVFQRLYFGHYSQRLVFKRLHFLHLYMDASWLPHQTILPCLAEMSSLFHHSPLSCLSEYLFLLWATILCLNNLYIMAATSIGPMHFQIVAATTICLQAYRSSMVPSCSLHYQIEPCHTKIARTF